MLLKKIKKLWNAVTYEPVMFFYIASLNLSQISSQNLLLKKACYPGDIAPAATADCPDEEESQKIVTDIQSLQNIIVTLGPMMFLLFAGPWSDNHGKHRKPLMLLPICGQILTDLLSLLNIYFWSWSPTTLALSQSLPAAFSGWRACLIIGVIGYIGDISPIKSRTVRTGIFSALYFIGSPIAGILFSVLSKTVGFYGLFTVPVVLNLTGLGYLIFFVPHSDPVSLKNCKLKLWEGLFNPTQVIQSLKTLFKPRPNYQRAVLLLTVIAAPLTLASTVGEYAIFLLFVRYQFQWSEVDYGFFTVYKSTVIVIGTLITTRVFSRLLGISDAIIGVMASATLIMASIGYAFATVTWELFVYPLVDFMQGATLAVVYAIASKSVEGTELVQVSSMIGIVDAAYPLINMPLYNQVYKYTFTHLAGATFLLSALYGLITLVIFGFIYVLQKHRSCEEQSKS